MFVSTGFIRRHPNLVSISPVTRQREQLFFVPHLLRAVAISASVNVFDLVRLVFKGARAERTASFREVFELRTEPTNSIASLTALNRIGTKALFKVTPLACFHSSVEPLLFRNR